MTSSAALQYAFINMIVAMQAHKPGFKSREAEFGA